jgi:hypothetical protein
VWELPLSVRVTSLTFFASQEIVVIGYENGDAEFRPLYVFLSFFLSFRHFVYVSFFLSFSSASMAVGDRSHSKRKRDETQMTSIPIGACDSPYSFLTCLTSIDQNGHLDLRFITNYLLTAKDGMISFSLSLSLSLSLFLSFSSSSLFSFSLFSRDLLCAKFVDENLSTE